MIKGRNKLLEKINKNNDVWISGAYKNNRSKIIIKFHKCQHEVLVDVDHYVNMNQGCPICNGSRVVAGINDIFTTDRWMVDLGVSEEDAKRYSRCSNKKITVKCPDCGKNKKIAINNIYKNNILQIGLNLKGTIFILKIMIVLLKHMVDSIMMVVLVGLEEIR